VSRPLLGLLLVSVFVIAFVVSVPARILNLVLPSGQVLMSGYSGTVWHGRAARCALATDSGYFNLGTVEWSLDPLSLLLFSPSLKVQSQWGRQRITGQVQIDGRQSFSLEDVEASVSARVLQRFLPVAVDGNFGATVSHLQIENGLPIEGEGRLRWRNAGWQSAQGTMPLGSYALDFKQAQSAPLRGNVTTISGPVEASGGVTLTQKSYDLDIFLTSVGGLNSQLKQALSLIAQPVAEGYRIVLKGQLTEIEHK
jgi:general secretion pathway protein N